MRRPTILLFAVASLLAACGSHDATSPPDAPDAPGGAVRVTVTQGGQPMSGLTAYFLEADNTIAATTTTDAAGRASAVIHAGGSVSVVNSPLAGAVESYDLTSWVAVQPGDDLQLDLPIYRPALSVTVSAPVATTIPGVKSYRAEVPCGGTEFFLAGGSGELSTDFRCTGDPHTSDFTVFAQDTNEQDIAALIASDVSVLGGSVALTGTYQPLVDVPISYTIPAGSDVIALTVEAFAPTEHGLMSEGNTTLYPSGGSASGAVHWPAQITTGTRVIQSDTGDNQEVLSWAPVDPEIAIELADQHGQALTAQPALDVTTQTVTWPLSADGVPAELAIVAVNIEMNGEYAEWTIVSPGATPQVALPQLPLANPSSRITDPTDEGVGVTLLRVPGGTAYRTAVLGPGGFAENFSGLMAATASGTIGEVFQPSVPL